MKLAAAVAAMKCSLLLRERISEETFESYPKILSKDADVADLLEAEKAAFSKSMTTALLHFFEGDDIAVTLVELLALRVVEPKAAEVLELVSPGNGEGVTILTAARAAGYTDSPETGNHAGCRGEAPYDLRDTGAGRGVLPGCFPYGYLPVGLPGRKPSAGPRICGLCIPDGTGG